FLPSDQPPLLSGRRCPADVPRDLFLGPVSCRNGGENEKTIGVLISDVLAQWHPHHNYLVVPEGCWVAFSS
ncbi:MAG: hypothetical protein AABZ40_04205, partial [Thermodesulfobacteriota bacterium]